MRQALVRTGMSPAAIEAEMRKLPVRPDSDIELDAEEGLSVGLFEAMTTQWRRAGVDGVLVGLEYTAIAATAAGFEIPVTPQRMVDLRDMEAEALRVLAEKRA